jgi:hypothetical protein
MWQSRIEPTAFWFNALRTPIRGSDILLELINNNNNNNNNATLMSLLTSVGLAHALQLPNHVEIAGGLGLPTTTKLLHHLTKNNLPFLVQWLTS